MDRAADDLHDFLVRIAAVGDLHCGVDCSGRLATELRDVDTAADVLLIAGDLTQHGLLAEAHALAGELAKLALPVVCVLGNHDYHNDSQDDIRAVLEAAGVIVLEGEARTAHRNGVDIGIAGIKGFGCGFVGACAADFGEVEMKLFARLAKRAGDDLRAALASLDSQIKIALTHYAPVDMTLRGERHEIYPFLGSYFLGEAIDQAHCDLAVHGHAHHGTEWGVTPGGVPVRNVARPVIRSAYRVYELHPRGLAATVP